MGVEIEIRVRLWLSWRAQLSGVVAKDPKHLNFRPKMTVEESVRNMVEQIRRHGYDDFENPQYYNIRWMRLLEEAAKIIAITGSVFEAPPVKEIVR